MYSAQQLQAQLDRGPQEDEGFFRLKVTGNGETNWVNVSPEQLARIIATLSES